MVKELTGESIEYGFKIAALFVEATTEIDPKDPRKQNGYMLLTVGGRRGAFNVKYDPEDGEIGEFLENLRMGDEVFASVSVSAFRDSCYFALRGLQWLRVPERLKVATPAKPVSAGAGGKP